jgi:S1-C subfamily serine protease
MKKKIVKYGIVFLLCFGLLFGVSSCSDSPLKEFCQTDEKVVQLEQQIEDTYALINSISTEVIKANVTVETTSYNTILHITTTKVTGQGSGVIFYENDTTYYVLTNQHVVYKDPSYSQQKFEITDYLGNLYTGTLIAGDTNYDLAIVSFKKTQVFY